LPARRVLVAGDSRPKGVTVRPTWDQYFMQIANIIATRSTCLRRSVGAVLVKNKRIMATGYNGTLTKLTHCEKIGCLREKNKIPSGQRQELCRGMHAEANAFLFASTYGIDMHNATLYSTNQPCVSCAKMIIQAGIKRVVFEGAYPDQLALKLFKEAKVKLEKYPKL
jgi:dCMP deaminase